MRNPDRPLHDQPLPAGLASKLAGHASTARQYPIFGSTWFGYRMRSFLAPMVLLDSLVEIEEKFGRVRNPDDRWGPRRIDLDLLVFGDHAVQAPGLQVPHRRLHERGFVLVPLAQIAPGLEIPGLGRVSDLLAAIDASSVEAID